jgi:hypothetical protein
VEEKGGFRVEIPGHEAYTAAGSGVGMVLTATALALGPLGSPPGIVVTVVLLALVILVGRFVLALAWRLVLIALAALVVLWVLAALGFSVGVF